MARVLKYTWVRLGIYTTLVIALTVAVFLSSLWALQVLQLREFMDSLPLDQRAEMQALERAGQSESLRALQIYAEYWKDDPLYGNATAVAFTLILCTALASTVSFLLARAVTHPMSSVADAAMRIASGDLGARAERAKGTGELVELVGHFNQMAASLEALERERKETAAAIAHELRTPLAILQGRLHALCDQVIEGSSGEYHKLLGQVIHLGRLVEDLRELSLSEAGRLSLHCVPLDLAALVEDHLQAYVALAQRRGIRTDLRTEPARVLADPDRIRQILSNLFDNVLRYAASGGLLRVRVTRKEHWAILQVRDAGPGLPERLKARLTVSPYRERMTLASKVDPHAEGSGLGLAMVRSLVQQHGGRLRVHNASNLGTVFTISLPLAAVQ